MRSLTRHLLVPAATAAISAATIAALIAGPAAAATAGLLADPAPSETVDPKPEVMPQGHAPSAHKPWGPYFSDNHKAKAWGRVHFETKKSVGTEGGEPKPEEAKPGEAKDPKPAEADLTAPGKGGVTVSGHLQDKDWRRQKCAYVQFKVHHVGAPKDVWTHGPSYKKCGYGHRTFSFTRHNVDGVLVRVSQIHKWGHHPIKKGDWHHIYGGQV